MQLAPLVKLLRKPALLLVTLHRLRAMLLLPPVKPVLLLLRMPLLPPAMPLLLRAMLLLPLAKLLKKQ